MSDKLKLNTSHRSLLLFFYFVIFTTNLTQMPFIIQLGITNISIGLWLILLLLLLINQLIVFNKEDLKIIIFIISFFILTLISSLLFQIPYYKSSLIYPFVISCFVFLVGYFFSPVVDTKKYNNIFLSYIISGLIVAISVYEFAFPSGFSWSSTSVYAYGSKNSVSQLLLTVLILLVITQLPKNRLFLIGKWIVISSLTFFIIMLKSRASIIGIFVLLLIILMSDRKNSKRKKWIIVGLIIFIIFLVVNENFYTIFVNDILFAGRDPDNLNSLSSGRAEMFQIFPKLFVKYPFFGIGPYYIESFPLSLLLQHGFIGAIPLFIFSFAPLFWVLKNFNKQDIFHVAFLIITLTYWINGLFEELSPFGPGVKCYLLWLMFGLLYRRQKNKEMLKENVHI